MDDLNAVGQIKTSRSLCNYELNVSYQITNIKKVQTKFGHSVIIETDGEYQTFLPKRYGNLDDENLCKLLEQCKSGQLFFKVTERKEILGKLCPLLTFSKTRD